MIRRITLNNDPYQSFLHTILGREYKLVLAWNGTNNYWALDVYDNVTGDLLQGGSAIVAGLNLIAFTSPYTLFATFLTKQGILSDPTRFDLELGFLYTGDIDALQQAS